ncbi:unnamed protein product, partial [Effrenium voratum]
DVVKEAVKASLHIMQLTESVNRAATQVERIKFVLGLEDMCLSSICLVLALTAALPMCLLLFLSRWLLDSGLWRYLLWLPGAVGFLPKALRVPLLDAASRAEEYRKQQLGDDLERMLTNLWQRIPDGTEASHLYLFKRYVLAC